MSETANIQWIFDNAIIGNYLAYAHGLIGILVVAMLGIGTPYYPTLNINVR